MSGASDVELSEIVITAQEIARNATKQLGGYILPQFEDGIRIHTNSNLSIALVSNCLLLLCTEIKDLNEKSPIESDLIVKEHEVELKFYSSGLKEGAYRAVAQQLDLLIGGEHPSIRIESSPEYLSICFKRLW
jgi:hypothetical protein